jgi:predicted AlkP superfamily pyrophosphatase or phosphodiesterase
MTAETRSMMDIAPTVSAVLGLPAPVQAKGCPMPSVVKDMLGKRRAAILALDAFGLFAWNLWKEEMPYLRSLHARRSVILRSVMPSITPVNFATMVTGADQPGHGILTRHDSFACETLFDTVRRSGNKSAGIGIDDYTGTALLGRYADICGNAGEGSDDTVADRIIEISERHQPMFLIAQLGRVDDVFHKYGPSSPEVVPMLRGSDRRLVLLVERLARLEYGIIILADHGQHDVRPGEDEVLKGNHGTESPEDCLVPCTWV